VEIAVDFERHVLGGLNYILDADRLRLPREVVAPLRSAHGLHQATAPQAEEDLLDVVVGESFLLRELARRDGALPRALGEVQ